MGLCASNSAAASDPQGHSHSKEVDKMLTRDHKKDKRVHKLLLLGAGESGKSTLFKQMILLYGSGWKEEDRLAFRSTIHGNVIRSIQTLLHESSHFERTRPDAAIQGDEMRRLAEEVLELKESTELNPERGAQIARLWREPAIRVTYSLRNSFQLTDSAKYFFDQLETISSPGYIPTTQDCLRSRVRTTGIVEEHYRIEDNDFAMFDVGGQRNERKKWIHCFDNVTAVLFVAALSAYDLKLYEDERQNRMEEALNLFEQVCTMRWFKNVSIILLLNKKDVFAEKLRETPLREFFPDYDGDDDDWADAALFIEDMFREKAGNRRLYVHITCATETDNVMVVFNAVKDTIIRESLKEGGLLM